MKKILKKIWAFFVPRKASDKDDNDSDIYPIY